MDPSPPPSTAFANRLIVLAGDITKAVFQVHQAHSHTATARAGANVEQLAKDLRNIQRDVEGEDWSGTHEDKDKLSQSIEAHRRSLCTLADVLDDKNYNSHKLDALRALLRG